MFDAALSILFSVSILVFFRLLKTGSASTLQVITTNYLVAFFLGWSTSKGKLEHFPAAWPEWTGIAIILGMMFIGTFFLFALSSRKAGVALTAVASRMSVLIPVAGGILIFHEQAGLGRWIGLAIVFPAFYYTLYNNDNGIGFSLRQAALPLALLLGTGMNDLLMNLAIRKHTPVDISLMLAAIFGIAFIIGSTIMLYNTFVARQPFNPGLIPAGVLLGTINYASTYFLLRSMTQFDASVLFPVVNASIVVLAALTDFVFFRHQPGKHQLVGMVLAVISIILITGG